MVNRDSGMGCGYAGKGDMRQVGGESLCYHGKIRRVVVTTSGKLSELRMLCPQCLGAWRSYRESIRF